MPSSISSSLHQSHHVQCRTVITTVTSVTSFRLLSDPRFTINFAKRFTAVTPPSACQDSHWLALLTTMMDALINRHRLADELWLLRNSMTARWSNRPSAQWRSDHRLLLVLHKKGKMTEKCLDLMQKWEIQYVKTQTQNYDFSLTSDPWFEIKRWQLEYHT